MTSPRVNRFTNEAGAFCAECAEVERAAGEPVEPAPGNEDEIECGISEFRCMGCDFDQPIETEA